MRELKGDLWKQPGYHCITTNGTVRKDGACVMGRGIAAEAKHLYPALPYAIGKYIKEYGNHVGFFGPNIWTFPVKHNWWERADLDLIARSTKELEVEATIYYGHTFYLPRPGCGNGGLDWEQVRPIVADLPDNVVVIHL